MSTISCTEFQRLLDDAVESKGDVAGLPLSEHASTCPHCRTLWQEHCVLERAIGIWSARTPSIDLVEEVAARYAFEQPVRAKTVSAHSSRPAPGQSSVAERSPLRQAWGSVAVAAIVLVGASWMVSRTTLVRNGSEQATTQVATNDGQHRSTPADNNDAELETLVENAGSAYMVLASQTADAVVKASRIVAPTRIAVVETEEINNAAPKSEGWGKDFQPIGREFGKALDFLFEAVPPESSPSI